MNALEVYLILFIGTILGVVWTLVYQQAVKYRKEKKQRETNVDALIHSLAKNNNTFMNEIIRLEKELREEREKNK